MEQEHDNEHLVIIRHGMTPHERQAETRIRSSLDVKKLGTAYVVTGDPSLLGSFMSLHPIPVTRDPICVTGDPDIVTRDPDRSKALLSFLNDMFKDNLAYLAKSKRLMKFVIENEDKFKEIDEICRI